MLTNIPHQKNLEVLAGFKGLFTGMWSNIEDIRSPIVTISFAPARNSEKSCGTSFFFYIEAAAPEKPEKRGLSCSRAQEVPPTSLKKKILAKFEPNSSETPGRTVTDGLKLLLLHQKLTPGYWNRYET